MDPGGVFQKTFGFELYFPSPVLPSLTLRLLKGDKRLAGLVAGVQHLQHLSSSVLFTQKINEQFVDRALIWEEVRDPQHLHRASLRVHPGVGTPPVCLNEQLRRIKTTNI